MKKKYHIETLAIHAGQSPDPATLSRAVPIYRTTAYNFKNSEHAANLFALKELGNIYSRLMNPTNDVLEQRLAALEGGAAALTLSSGTAAIYFALTNICKCGDEIVSANNLYGGTFTQFDAILPQNGIKVNFTPVNDFSAVEAAINERTKAIFIETVGNPTLEIADIEGYAKIAQKHKLPLVVDSTLRHQLFCVRLNMGRTSLSTHSQNGYVDTEPESEVSLSMQAILTGLTLNSLYIMNRIGVTTDCALRTIWANSTGLLLFCACAR